MKALFNGLRSFTQLGANRISYLKVQQKLHLQVQIYDMTLYFENQGLELKPTEIVGTTQFGTTHTDFTTLDNRANI